MTLTVNFISEVPEEPLQDRRSLYEKLEDQKQRKQEEHDEPYKLSECI